VVLAFGWVGQVDVAVGRFAVEEAVGASGGITE
jgi:hypothetical protein